MTNFLQLHTQCTRRRCHRLSSIRTGRFMSITPPDMPCSAPIASKKWRSQDNEQSRQASWKQVKYVVQAGRSFAQVLVATMIAEHRIEGIKQAIGCGGR